MGRAALLIALAMCVGCAAETPAGIGAHGALACAECHQGGRADRDLAAVPPATCTSSGCHGVDIPGTLTLQTVRFEHRGHASTDSLAVGCPGCHTHAAGDESIAGSAETCGLCHQEELAGPRGEPCRMCHLEPSHEGFTAQGLAVRHQDLPWIGRGCLRCHYEVAEPLAEVSTERCLACHRDVGALQRAGVGVDLHPAHTSVACRSCHDPDTHRIESMSSAVNLVCADCHTTEHGVEVDSGGLGPATCVSCHTETHREPQAMLLGIEPSCEATAPAEHFVDGLTCRSCHAAGSGSETPAGATTSDACAVCHRAEYRVIPQWWDEGIRERLAVVEPFVSRAEAVAARLPDADPARASLATTRACLDFVRLGVGSHNLPLTHRILEDALKAASDVYSALGRAPPTRPGLGRPPRSGFCYSCHYQIEELGFSEDMPEELHREIGGN